MELGSWDTLMVGCVATHFVRGVALVAFLRPHDPGCKKMVLTRQKRGTPLENPPPRSVWGGL